MTVALDKNNPGGMNDGNWAKAQPGYAGPNGRYAAFKTLTDGVNAMKSLLLKSYINKGYDTPRKIASRWAPDSDGNNSLAYATVIATGLHIGIDTKIAPEDVSALVLVQARIENSKFPAAWKAEQQRVAMLAPTKGKA